MHVFNMSNSFSSLPIRFILGEMAFFHRWWKAQNETSRNIVKRLVENGQLEFINGGWSMNDEAVTHYVDIIDQMSLGSKYFDQISCYTNNLIKYFGLCC